MLDVLAKNGIDIGAIIDLAIEKIKLEKVVQELEKKQSKEQLKEQEKLAENSLEDENKTGF